MRCPPRAPTTIVFTPYPGATIGSFNVQAWESSRVTGTLTVGTANTYTSTVAGAGGAEDVHWHCRSATRADLSSFSSSVSGATLYAIVLKPDGTPLTNNNFTATQTSPTAFVAGFAGAAHHRPLHRVQCTPYQCSTNTHDHHLQWARCW